MRRRPILLVVVSVGNDEDRHIVQSEENGKKNKRWHGQIGNTHNVTSEQGARDNGDNDEKPGQRVNIESRAEKAIVKQHDPAIVAIRDAARIGLTRSPHVARGHFVIPRSSMQRKGEMRKQNWHG
ncbi:MAG: hypothetical protein AMXMBFR82_49690 [Candidatus Hydrogenedentota bacterium]